MQSPRGQEQVWLGYQRDGEEAEKLRQVVGERRGQCQAL